MNTSHLALLSLLSLLAACATTPEMPATPYPAQRAYLSVGLMADRSDVVAFAPSQQTIVTAAMPAGLERDAWQLVRPGEPAEPEESEEFVIAPLSGPTANACPEAKAEKNAAPKAAKAKPKHKARKTAACAH